MSKINLVVFDMAGTTVKDQDEVLKCFLETAKEQGLNVDKDRVNPIIGLPKRFVFERLW